MPSLSFDAQYPLAFIGLVNLVLLQIGQDVHFYTILVWVRQNTGPAWGEELSFQSLLFTPELHPRSSTVHCVQFTEYKLCTTQCAAIPDNFTDKLIFLNFAFKKCLDSSRSFFRSLSYQKCFLHNIVIYNIAKYKRYMFALLQSKTMPLPKLAVTA